MESRYFLFPGQTLENTKISDRAHALHITATEWSKIRKHLDRKKDIQALIGKEENKRRYLAEGNRAMTEKWENSLEVTRQHKKINNPQFKVLIINRTEQTSVRSFRRIFLSLTLKWFVENE